jgi:hypothetical protein
MDRRDTRSKFAELLFARHFVGDAFTDELFNTDSNEREKVCSWKIQSYMPLFSPLTSQSWRWRAVGIPLDLVDKSIAGDIDLMFAVPPWPNTSGQRAETTYRCYELKTSKVKLTGEVKSLKEGKFRKTIGQLEKLMEFGAPQVFLLEAYILEAGYSRTVAGKMPIEVRNSISRKLERLNCLDCGYVALPIEQIPGYDENATGLVWPAEFVKRAKSRPMRGSFLKLIGAIEECVRSSTISKYRLVVTYCFSCRHLTAISAKGPYICNRCKSALVS